ncbi:5196_t:CDS:2 [Diversispora eburnea]|uniref:5196_t:CDS:1 n=1 Tax=Diversispora eburnea TaxID=1213867 RepID=A0A9N9CR08_9GLOM|nr:5196_t:CDS:2 [Diversispora eburnea]
MFANIQKFQNLCIILFIVNFLFACKDAYNLLDKFEGMNNRQIAINNRQIKIERKIPDIQKLLVSSKVESDYTIENEFIKKFVQEVANFTIDKRIYPDEAYLKFAALGVQIWNIMNILKVEVTKVGALIIGNTFQVP